MSNIDISIISPIYNEENNIAPFLEKIKQILEKISDSYEIIFAMDPSTDNTELKIKQFAQKDKRIKYEKRLVILKREQDREQQQHIINQCILSKL